MPVVEKSGMKHKVESGVEEIRKQREDQGRKKTETWDPDQ